MKSLVEYQAAARKYQATMTDRERIAHACLGVAAEAGEVCAIFQKSLQGHEIDREHLKRELGDVLWFAAEMFDCIGSDMSTFHGWSDFEKLRSCYGNDGRAPIEIALRIASTAGACALVYDNWVEALKEAPEKDNSISDFKGCATGIVFNIVYSCTVLGFDIEEVAELNLKKLAARYPEGEYRLARSLNRNPEDD